VQLNRKTSQQKSFLDCQPAIPCRGDTLVETHVQGSESMKEHGAITQTVCWNRRRAEARRWDESKSECSSPSWEIHCADAAVHAQIIGLEVAVMRLMKWIKMVITSLIDTIAPVALDCPAAE